MWKIWDEKQISEECQGTYYDQPLPIIENINGEDADCDYSDKDILHHRLLSQWYLVPSLEEITEEVDSSRLALPATGLFSNTVLYGWLQPRNISQECIFVRIADLDRWVVNRSKDRRGYWAMTNTATYWLQDPCNENIGNLASQEDLHLEYRLRLGLLSLFIDHVSGMSDDNVAETSKLSPQAFLSQLVSDSVTEPNHPFSWEAVQPHGNFLGTHLALLRLSLTISCPLLLGLLQAEQEGATSKGTYSINCRLAQWTGPGKRKRSSSRKSQAISNSVVLAKLAYKAEQLTQQRPWGEPAIDMQPGKSAVSSDSNSRSDQVGDLRPKNVIQNDSQHIRNSLSKKGKLSSNQAFLPFEEDLPAVGHTVQVEVPSEKVEPEVVLSQSETETDDQCSQEPTILLRPGQKTKAVYCEDVQAQGGLVCSVTENLKEETGPQPKLDDSLAHQDIELMEGTQLNAQKSDLFSGLSIERPSEGGDTRHSLRKEEPLLEREPVKDSTGFFFRFIKGAQAVSVCINDLSLSMNHVMDAAKKTDTLKAVFGWPPQEQRGIDEGTLAIQVMVGNTGFIVWHFDQLTAQDVVQIAPLSCAVDLELKLIDV